MSHPDPPSVRAATTDPPDDPPHPSDERKTVSWVAAMALVLVAFAGTIGFLAAAGYFLTNLKSDELRLPLLIVVVTVALLGAIALLVIAFGLLKLVDEHQALGLPEGSVRAVIALTLILLFAALTVFLIVKIGASQAGTPIVDVAKQTLTILGTLVTAVSSFYFGSRSVTDAAKITGTKAGSSGSRTSPATAPAPVSTTPELPDQAQPVMSL